jgi:hypothetical protein
VWKIRVIETALFLPRPGVGPLLLFFVCLLHKAGTQFEAWANGKENLAPKIDGDGSHTPHKNPLIVTATKNYGVMGSKVPVFSKAMNQLCHKMNRNY